MNLATEEEAAAAYDRMTARQIAEMNQEPLVVDQAEEIRTALVADNLEGIRFWTQDLGALVAVREAFPGINRVGDLTRHLINLETREVEDLAKEIDEWRTAS